MYTPSGAPSYEHEMERCRGYIESGDKSMLPSESEMRTVGADECATDWFFWRTGIHCLITEAFTTRLENEMVKKWVDYFNQQMTHTKAEITKLENKIRFVKKDQLEIEASLQRYIYKNGPIGDGEYSPYINLLYLKYENAETDMACLTNDLNFLYTKVKDLKVVLDNLTRMNRVDLPKSEMKKIVKYVENKSKFNDTTKLAFRQAMSSAYNVDQTDSGLYNEAYVLDDAGSVKTKVPTASALETSGRASSFNKMLRDIEKKMCPPPAPTHAQMVKATAGGGGGVGGGEGGGNVKIITNEGANTTTTSSSTSSLHVNN